MLQVDARDGGAFGTHKISVSVLHAELAAGPLPLHRARVGRQHANSAAAGDEKSTLGIRHLLDGREALVGAQNATNPLEIDRLADARFQLCLDRSVSISGMGFDDRPDLLFEESIFVRRIRSMLSVMPGPFGYPQGRQTGIQTIFVPVLFDQLDLVVETHGLVKKFFSSAISTSFLPRSCSS